MLTDKSTLALGVRGGFATRSVDFDDYIIKHPDDELMREGKQSETRPDVTLGLWYEHEKYYAGISTRGIVAKADYSTLGIENEKSIVITAGYHIAPRPDWTLTPSAQFITATGRSMVQGGILLDHDKIFWTGLAYRHEDAVSAVVGLSALEKKLRISYAFDYTTGNKAIKAGTSHEIMIGCNIGRSSAKRRSVHKRVSKMIER